ncbi:hypothetical protein [Kribbella sp. HUAS MG21]|uniref:Uncharacterized protein n=1 Tax=Kribbella sp. HUAS MG21 TaxID=3160966 RepID=A0AAU7TMI8_9ACTN
MMTAVSLPLLIDFTPAEIAEILAVVVGICAYAALPGAVALAVAGYRTATRHRAGHALGYGLIGAVLSMPPAAVGVFFQIGWWAAPLLSTPAVCFALYVARTRPQPPVEWGYR